eukprot:GHVN01076310.1.p1 GENE.GHVN01076310.1~~GHVN01076310.1.p1  ORF type:complete len:223 (+),score=19.73 GHVN01076310.1:71-739(+)
MARIYRDTGKAIRMIEEEQRGFRDAVYSVAPATSNGGKKVFALAHNVLRNKARLRKCMEKASLLTDVKDPYQCLAMVYDMVAGGGIQGGGALKRILTSKQSVLMAAWGLDNAEAQEATVIKHPSYFRVFPGVISVMELKKQLLDHGIKTYCDAFIPNLLVVPAECVGVVQAQMSEGRLGVFHDKSTCLSALAADVKTGQTIMDSCAAPGSNTLLIMGEVDCR